MDDEINDELKDVGGAWGGQDLQGAVGGEWPIGVGWGPGGAPAGWIQPVHQAPGVNAAVKGDNDSGCGTDSEEDMEEEQDAPEEDLAENSFVQQISEAEYEKQRRDYTRQSLDALLQSPEYQRKHKSCRSCWSLWLEGQCRDDCMECGGFALVRSCPICSGKCGTLWRRNIDMSHSHNEAHWDGECALPREQREAYMLRVLTDPDEEAILDGMMDLNTGSATS